MPPESAPGTAQVLMLAADRRIDRRILQEADALEAAGWQVRILAMPLDPGEVDADPRVFRVGSTPRRGALREGLVLSAYRRVRSVLTMNGAPMRALKALAWRLFVDPETFYPRLFAADLAGQRAAVFVAHDLPMLPVAHGAAQRCGARLVYDSHELYVEQEFSEGERRTWSRIEARHIGACDAVITVNPSIARELERRYGLREVQVIYNAQVRTETPAGERRFHERWGLAESARVLLYQGGLSADRNLEALVAAMARVQDSSVHLVLMGDGKLSGRLARRITSLGLAGRVHLQGAVPQDALQAWTCCADAGIIPYRANCLNNTYCTPNKLFEFMSAGLPVLASDLPELRRIVEEGGMGRVADLGSCETIAAAIDAFFADPERLGAWARGAEAAARTCNWEREGARFAAIFEQFRP